MEVKHNPLLEGLSGKFNDRVFYNRYGKTFSRKAPGSYNKMPTEKQALVRESFLAASAFAKIIIADPALKAIYSKKAKNGRTAFTAAMADYLAMFKE